MMSESKKPDSAPLTEILPLYLTDDLVLYPGVVAPLVVEADAQTRLVNDILTGDDKRLVIALRKPGQAEGSRLEEPYPIACSAIIVKMLRIPDGSFRLFIQGLARVSIDEVRVIPTEALKAKVTRLKPEAIEGLQMEALTRVVREDFNEVIDLAQYLPAELKVALVNISDPGTMVDFIAANLNLKTDERQEILTIVDVRKRLQRISQMISREKQLLSLGNKLQSDVSEALEKRQREYFLREQLKAIRKELGEEEEGAELRELKERLDALKAPEHVKEAAGKEMERLSRISPSSPEYNVGRTYIDWILDLPWEVSSKDRLNVKEAERILDRDHYGLNDVKERILEYLAVRQLKGQGKGSILCFVGPPGVGKTSIGKSIASAMGRKFVRMSLGGLRDEAEIRGHRRTYIGALPGRIIQNLKRVGANNPVFMLDEIDKLGTDFRGDPSSAMLEVLDPEQNNSFQDNYLELDFDLSRVMFITTANYLETIPEPLRDRMEIIKLPGYITPEKVQIARRYLVPRQIEENGLTGRHISFTNKVLEQIVVFYTREAGVRTLERTIGRVCRKAAVEVAGGNGPKKFNISTHNLEKYLGAPKVMPTLHNLSPRVGVATGLAWTPVGGVVLMIEAISWPGEGRLKVTGRLGEVMKESSEIAMSFLRSQADRLKIPQDYFKTHDFHVHIPEGATPKDGPSAGITLTAALASLFTGKPVRHDVAMTGEITLEGKVLPIGGLREKAVAAARAHMKTVICPEDNRGDLEDIPDIIKSRMKFKFVQNINEVLRAVLLPRSR